MDRNKFLPAVFLLALPIIFLAIVIKNSLIKHENRWANGDSLVIISALVDTSQEAPTSKR